MSSAAGFEAGTEYPSAAEISEKDTAQQKLREVNHLLLHLQQNPESTRKLRVENRSVNKNNSVAETVGTDPGRTCSSSHGNGDAILSATNTTGNPDDDEAGIFVKADRDLPEGCMILSCGSEGFVLETPEHRRTLCSYCCYKTGVSSLVLCPDCKDCYGNPMVGYCPDCADTHGADHTEECRILRCLKASITKDATGDEEAATTSQWIREIFGSSVALLTIRLLSRQQRILYQNEADVPGCDRSTNGGTSRSSSWREDFGLLYEHPLPANSPYSTIATLLGAALDAVGHTVGAIPTIELVRSTLGRVLGCSHAIVDPSLPLGKQTLGRAVYAGHSFYNHSCAPTAYLSAHFPEATDHRRGNGACRRMTAKVHLLRPVAKEEEITLSYLPLSGLSRRERMDQLDRGYGFRCRCPVCCDDRHPLALLPKKDFGFSGIDSIREIQFGLNDRLLGLARVLRQWDERNRELGEEKTARATYKTEREALIVTWEEECRDILGMIAMTQRGIQNQNLPECHEVSIESDRLSAAAYDWMLSLAVFSKTTIPSSAAGQDQETGGEAPAATTMLADAKDFFESSGEKHREFFRKAEIIRDLFDPVALGVQRLAQSSSILRSRQLGLSSGNNSDSNSIGDARKAEESERKRGWKILATCLGHDHPWVRASVLSKEETPSPASAPDPDEAPCDTDHTGEEARRVAARDAKRKRT